MAETDPHDEESDYQAEFVKEHADPEYQECLTRCQKIWKWGNRVLFDGRLHKVHIGIDDTHPRTLLRVSRTTNYGGRMQIILNAGLVFATNTNWVRFPWPARGLRRCVRDLLLRGMVRQYVLEVEDAEERGNRGYGSLFAREANRIRNLLGLDEVVVRHRGTETDQERKPLCAFWPHCLRPSDYYGGAVTEALLDQLTGRQNAGRRSPAPPGLGVYELIHRWLCDDKVERARAVLKRHIEWLEKLRRAKLPVLRRVESGKEDVPESEGKPGKEMKALPTFDPEWTSKENGIVRKMAEAISEARDFSALPILADALEDMGCNDYRILRHLRHKMEHTAGCWVLNGLLAAAGQKKPK